jgi:hypothetical protein
MEIAYRSDRSQRFWTLIRAYSLFIIRAYSLFKSERLSARIKLSLLKALIKSVMTYACPAWEFTADIHLSKFQRLQNNILRTIGKLPTHTLVYEYVIFHVFYIYDCITKLCRQQAEVIPNHENANALDIGKNARHKIYKKLKRGDQACVRPFKCLDSRCNMSYTLGHYQA